MRKEALKKVLSMLSPRERAMLELRYGLDGKPPRTLDCTWERKYQSLTRATG